MDATFTILIVLIFSQYKICKIICIIYGLAVYLHRNL